MDVSNLPIAFSGFDTSDLSKRVEELNKIVNDLNPAVKPLHIGHFLSGPCNGQQVSKASFVQFATARDARVFLHLLGRQS
eukprot:3821888-Pyramimonas_sp.AAC.1